MQSNIKTVQFVGVGGLSQNTLKTLFAVM